VSLYHLASGELKKENHKLEAEVERLNKELEQEKKDFKEANDKCFELIIENKRLNKRIKELEEGFKATTEDLCEESTKIEKAIEYIKKHGDYNKSSGCIEELDLYKINELLEILKGSDKE